MEYNFSHLRTLVVDDDPVYQMFLKKILEKTLKTQTIVMNNPIEAFAWLEENPVPDLILMDMEMPLMDGFTAIKKLRSNESTKNVIILACTRLSSKDLVLRLAQIGIDDFLYKNSDIKLIAGKILKALKSIDEHKEAK